MDLLEQFLNFEKDNDLFSRTYCGELYWHMMRFIVFEKIRTAKDPSTSAYDKLFRTRRTMLDKIKVLVRLCVFVLDQLVHRRLRKADILVNAQNNYRDIDGVLTDTLMDPLSEHFNMQPVYIDVDFWKPLIRKYPSCAGGMLRHFFYSVRHKVFKKHVDSVEEGFLATIIDIVKREFGIEISELAVSTRFNSIFCKAFSIYVRKILKKVRPKAVLTGCHYGINVFILTREAKRLGIPVIELQHGVIGRKHLSYNFIDIAGSAAYFPDYILTFGDYWTENIRLPRGVKAITAGSTYMESRSKNLRHIVRSEKTIVFYSGIDSLLIDILVQFSGIAKKNGYEVVCKMHPRECGDWRNLYPTLETQDIEIIDDNMDIYKLFFRGRHHVGVASTTLFEAIATGGMVHAHSSGRSYMSDMVEAGAVKEFTSAEELMKNIIEINEDQTAERNRQVANQLYEPNALENQINAIRKIMSTCKQND